MAFDPASRKTVSCEILDAAFAKNPHPDGKTMTALAEKLQLNKKQVSNFFERERRKANIVIESRRKGVNAGGSQSGGDYSDSATATGSLANHSFPTQAVSKSVSKSNSSSIKSLQSTSISVPEPIPYYNSSKRAAGHGPQLVKRESYYQALTSDQSDADEGEDDENQDAEGELESEVEHEPGNENRGKGRDEDEDIYARYRPSAHVQNPLVHKNKAEQLNKPLSSIASNYASRNARYASRSPLYAFPAAHTLDNFRTAPKIVPTRAVSTSPSFHSRSSSPLPMSNVQVAPSHQGVGLDSRQQSFDHSKRKRADGPVESPTVMFLRNPFPTPLTVAQSSSDAMFIDEQPVDDNICQNIDDFVGFDFESQPARKKARIWFSKPAPTVEVSDVVLAKSQVSDDKPSRTEKTARVAPSNSVDALFIEPRPARVSTRRSADAAIRAMQEVASERDVDSSDESAYGENEDGSRRKDNRPGAALRSTIACTELRQSFLSNPHPPTAVLESLAIRLGLGKKQVSNYFVRERKKAGYTIKIRHGLHRKRSSKKKVDKPAVVVTQHDEVRVEVDPTHYLPDEDDLSDEEEGLEDEDEDADSEMVLQSQDSAVNGRDDVPELAYDDQDGSSLRSETLQMQQMGLASAALMVPSCSVDSMTTASRQEDEDEIASPPYQAIHLPSSADIKNQSHITAEILANYDSQVGATSVSLNWL